MLLLMYCHSFSYVSEFLEAGKYSNNHFQLSAVKTLSPFSFFILSYTLVSPVGVLYYVYTPHVCLKPAKQTLPQCKHLAAGSPLHLPQGSVAQVALLWPVSSCVSPDSVPCREKTL